MKRIYLTVVSTVLLFAGCTNDLDEGMLRPSTEKSFAVELLGSINQVATTRVNDEGFCDGDGVGIYVVNYNGESAGTMLDEGNQANNVRYVFNETEYKWTPDYPVYYYDKVTPVDIIGYYPYVSNIDKVNVYSFEVQKDQSTDAANGLMGGYEASDFLWGKAEKITPTASRVNITFHHQMAGVQVELTEGTGWSENEWSGLDKQVLVTNTIRKASIDLATGEVTPIGEVPTTGTVPAVNSEGWRAVVVPQSVGASVALFNITVDGTPYIFRKSEQFEYVSGKLHKFTIEVSKKSASGLEFKLIGEAITAWESETITHDGTAREYVVINVPEASLEQSALKSILEEMGKDFTKIKYVKINGDINYLDFDFMREEMTSLTGVNLQNCTISGDPDSKDFAPNTIPHRAFYDKTMLQYFIYPQNITRIGYYAFYKCTGLRGEHSIPNSVLCVGDSAFEGCHNISNFNLPRNLEIIEQFAFRGCGISQLTIPHSVRIIDRYAFAECTGLANTTLILPDEVESIGEYAFFRCGFIGALTIPNKVKELPGCCFDGCRFDGPLKLPNGIQKIACHLSGSGDLVLPNSLVSLTSSFSGFSGKLVLPDNLTELTCSFDHTCKFEGPIEIPQSIRVIPNGFMANNTHIKTVILHSEIEEVGGAAFMRCSQLQKVICKSKVPPKLNENSFTSEYPIQVEVPEEALLKYQVADGWRDMIPSVYRDFTVDVELMRALNASFDKKTIVRAPSGMGWHIESKPEWISVSPESGDGKMEITVNFAEMAQGSEHRTGEVILKLNDYDYSVSFAVEQYNYEYGDGDMIVNQTATKGDGFDIVFMGDCFDAKDIAEGKYKSAMDEAIEHLFAVQPYTAYRDYFNVYTIIGHSPDSGLPTTYSVNRESKFGSQYTVGDSGGFQFKLEKEKCFEYACKVPTINESNLDQTVVVLIENSNLWGGITYMYPDGSALAVACMMTNDFPNDFRGVVQHEVGGHAIGKLADEYIYHSDFIDMCNCKDGCGHSSELLAGHTLGWYQNVSLNSNIYEVPWSHLIFDPQFSTSVDMYEGGYFHARGVFRSEPNSCMNNNIPYFSAISREQIVKRIMHCAGEEYSFDEFKKNDVAGMSPTLQATRSFSSMPEVMTNVNHNAPVIMEGRPLTK
ncbi:MAG: fimbrillin family protein [Tidjanibacter sp.]|nr:fimbrillin family protein [Tidjanibacter sp.]